MYYRNLNTFNGHLFNRNIIEIMSSVYKMYWDAQGLI